MIKVNLLNSKVQSDQQGLGQGVAIINEPPSPKETLVKILLMAVWTIGLVVMENMNIDELTVQNRRFTQEAEQVTSTLAALKAKSGKAEEVQGEIKKLNEKLALLQDLSRKRLKELKALDFIQANIPDGVWLSSLTYNGEIMTFVGKANNDKDINDFIEKLEQSVHFTEVIVKRQMESKEGEVSAKSFELTSRLGG